MNNEPEKSSRDIMRSCLSESFFELSDLVSRKELILTKAQIEAIFKSNAAITELPASLLTSKRISAPLSNLLNCIDEGLKNLETWDLAKCGEYIPALLSAWAAVNKTALHPSAEAAKTIGSVVSKKPEKFLMPISKLSSIITDPDFEFNCPHDVTVGHQKPKDGQAAPVKAYVTISFDSDNVSLPSSYTPFDREVYNAVCSLLLAGNRVIWSEQVYRTMTGKTGDARVSPQAVGAVTKSIEKQRFTKVTISADEQDRAWKGKNRILSWDENMLQLSGVEAVINGQPVRGWCYNCVEGKWPALYSYSAALGQIVTVPLKLLDTSSVSNTPEIIVMKNYLLREIEGIKNPHRQRNDKILYSTMFDTCLIDTKNPNQLKRYRDYIKRILDEWKQEQYIYDWTETKNGRSYDGIQIMRPPAQPKNQ